MFHNKHEQDNRIQLKDKQLETIKHFVQGTQMIQAAIHYVTSLYLVVLPIFYLLNFFGLRVAN